MTHSVRLSSATMIISSLFLRLVVSGQPSCSSLDISFVSMQSSMVLVQRASCSSMFLQRLREDRSLSIDRRLTSSEETQLSAGSSLELTCSFLSSFETIDIFWLHNGTLIKSFVSQVILCTSTRVDLPLFPVRRVGRLMTPVARKTRCRSPV